MPLSACNWKHWKVHKHEIILNFSWLKSNPYMPFVNFPKKIRFFSIDFQQDFDVRTFPRWLSIRGTKFFLIENYSMRMLSIRGTDFIACWAYEERISVHAQPAVKCEHFYMYNPCWAYAERILSHAEHTRNRFDAEHARKCLKVEYIGQIEYDFQKSRVTGPWDHKVSVTAKKVK